ncbi:MAG: hypothetical protein GY835_23560, partial [bacterium]|nr:hypothetical protein [bacterium]
WNGHASETSVDPFSQEQDFEGYNVYLAEESAPGSYVRLAGYDVEDYYQYHWSAELSDWEIARKRFYTDDLICAYAAAGCDDDSWHPLDFPRENPYFLPGFPDSVFYFEPILANACQFGLETPFVKIYPDAVCPDYSLPSEVPPDSISQYLTDDGFFKFYEYEYLIAGLLPAVTYRVSVTAFDYGSFAIDALPLETAIGPNSVPGTPYPDETNCCVETVGSIALVPDCGVPDQVVDITDIQLLIDHMFLSFTALCCDTEGDTD